VNALNAGRIVDTNLSRYRRHPSGRAAFEPNSTAVPWKTVEQGATTSVLLAASPLLDGVSGRYFEDRQDVEPNQPGIRRGVAAYALDPRRRPGCGRCRSTSSPVRRRRLDDA
jgi:hypothetical protein